MDCRKARVLITLRPDGAITNSEAPELAGQAGHLAGCVDCTREFELQEKLSAALVEIGREETPAPPELCGLVMGRLRAERVAVRRVAPSWLPVAWRKAVAAAAALLLIAGGSTGVMLKMADREKTALVYEIPSAGISTGTGSGATVTGNSPEGSVSGQVALHPPSEVKTPGGEQDGSPANNDTPNPVVPDSASIIGSTPEDNWEEPRVLLSSGMKVTSTTLTVSVGDLTEAREKSVAMAAGAGATTQVFPEQEKMVVLRFTAASDEAAGLVSSMARMGTLIDRRDENRDMTSIYNETVVQYNDLRSRAGATQDAAEQRHLLEQSDSYRQQLDNWEAEAGKRIITLWLESK